MRKILYPFFLLSLVVGIYYFFGENLAPLVQKILFVFGLAFAFFLFRGLFLFFFDWIFESFSDLFKTIIAGILFFLITIGFWGMFPENITSKIENLFANNSQEGQVLSSFKNGVTEGVGELSEKTGNLVSQAGENISEGVSDLSNKAGSTLSATGDSISEGAKNSVEKTQELLTSDRTPTNLLKNVKVKTETTTVEVSSGEVSVDIAKNEASAWKKPVVVYTADNSDENSFYVQKDKKDKNSENSNNLKTSQAGDESENSQKTSENSDNTAVLASENNTSKNTKAEKTNAQIAQMKKSGVRLVSSGVSKEDYTVVFRAVDAQVVFPVEYKVSQVLWTDSENTVDQVDFSVLTPNDTKAEISISLSESGDVYQKFFSRFANTSSEENQFFVSAESENSVTYATFFEGILWEITISLEGENLEKNDFYQILLPISFQKQD